MKKLLTLLAALMLMATSSGAAVKAPAAIKGNVALRPGAQAEFLQKMQRANSDLQAGDLSGQKNIRVQRRSVVAGDKSYDMTITNLHARMCDYIVGTNEYNETVSYSFEQVPYYLVQLKLVVTNVATNDTTSVYNHMLGWPAYCLFDTTKPDNYDIVTLDDMMNGAKNGFVNRFLQIDDGYNIFAYDAAGNIAGFPIVSNLFGLSQKTEGLNDWILATTNGETNQSFIDFKSFTKSEENDEIVLETETDMEFYLWRNYDIYSLTGLTIKYDGTLAQEGFVVNEQPIYIIGSNVNGHVWESAEPGSLMKQTANGVYEWEGDILYSGFKFNDGTWDNPKYNIGGCGDTLTLDNPYNLTIGYDAANIILNCDYVRNPKVTLNLNDNTVVVSGTPVNEEKVLYVIGENINGLQQWTPGEQQNMMVKTAEGVYEWSGESMAERFKISGMSYVPDYGSNGEELTLGERYSYTYSNGGGCADIFFANADVVANPHIVLNTNEGWLMVTANDAPVVVNPLLPDNVIYSSLIEGCPDWTSQTVYSDDEIESVWEWISNYYCIVGSGYKDGNHAALAYFSSPLIDLTNATSAAVSFDHAARFQTNIRELCKIVVREENDSEWTELEIPVWPEAGSWTYVNSGKINLSQFCGKKVYIAFKYESTLEGADTWDINNFNVYADIESPEDPEPSYPTLGIINIRINNGCAFRVTTEKQGEIEFDVVPDEFWTISKYTINGDDFPTEIAGNLLIPTQPGDLYNIEVELAYTGALEFIDINSGVANLDSNLKVYATTDGVQIEGLAGGEPIVVYNLAGQVIATYTAISDTMKIMLEHNAQFIVRVADKAVKVVR